MERQERSNEGGEPGQIGSGVESGAGLEQALRGSLPCVACGYDLRGISIRGVCPECGTAVRAAILYQVDPRAEAFAPLLAARLTATALVVWVGAGLLAILVAWWIRAGEMALHFLGWQIPLRWAPVIVFALGGLSALAALPLIKPTRSTPLSRSLSAAFAVLAYVPLLWAFWQIQLFDDASGNRPYTRYVLDSSREILRLAVGGSLIAIFLGLRPNIRELVRRSVALRTGRVDRQTLLAMIGAVALAMTGDVMRMLGGQGGDHVVKGVGTVVVLMGSLFLTLGFLGGLLDSWRISRAILTPAPTLRQVLGHDQD